MKIHQAGLRKISTGGILKKSWVKTCHVFSAKSTQCLQQAGLAVKIGLFGFLLSSETHGWNYDSSQ